MYSFAVLGIGNNLLQDDGAGIHVLELVNTINRMPNVRCLDGGTVGLALMSELSDLAGLIVIDAMRLKKAPGTVTVLQGANMDNTLRNHCGSAHEVGLSDLMDALRLSDSLPEMRALVGIEPEETSWGMEPTPEVAAAIPLAAERVLAVLNNWQLRYRQEHVA